jgi:hypothetical protein
MGDPRAKRERGKPFKERCRPCAARPEAAKPSPRRLGRRNIPPEQSELAPAADLFPNLMPGHPARFEDLGRSAQDMGALQEHLANS